MGDLAAWLTGRWSVSRTVNGGQGTFTGVAEFQADGDALCWRETGELQLDAYRGSARRTLTIHPAGERWEVRFDDGRPFHPLQLSDGSCEVRHRCGADVYDGRFDVDGETAFTVAWHVVGPGRDDTIVTRYARTAPPRNASR